MPDWGESPSWQPSSSANLDDAAVAQRLQEQYHREIGGASGGFGVSLEDESLAVARMLQVCSCLCPARCRRNIGILDPDLMLVQRLSQDVNMPCCVPSLVLSTGACREVHHSLLQSVCTMFMHAVNRPSTLLSVQLPSTNTFGDRCHSW